MTEHHPSPPERPIRAPRCRVLVLFLENRGAVIGLVVFVLLVCRGLRAADRAA
jgi:hypothetical protein